jgi:hypothetical protein
MRWILALSVLAGCPAGQAESLDGDGDGDSDPAEAACQVDDDCVAASTACCACPTFATSRAGGGDCGTVECPALECAPTAAFCDTGVCRLRCVEVEITQVCAQGFEVDAAGCAVDRCAAGPPVCEVDSDCARVAADCCGCELGGSDTAVPAAEVGAHLDGLDCADDVFCPGVNSCDEAETPRCLGGTCRLVRGPGLDDPLAVCGTPESPSCPDGQICVVNHPLAPPGVANCRQL